MNWQILIISVLILFISCTNEKYDYRYELKYSDEADSIKSAFYNLREEYSIIFKGNEDKLVDEDLLKKIDGKFVGGIIHNEFPANMSLIFSSDKDSLTPTKEENDVLLLELDQKNSTSFDKNVVKLIHNEDRQLENKQLRITQYALYDSTNNGNVAYQDNFYTRSSNGKVLKILVLYGQLKYKNEMVEIAQEMDNLFETEN